MRTLSDAHKAKLAAGRREAADLKAKQDLALIADYREWLKLERGAYEHLTLCRELGEGVEEAHKEFVAAWSIMPKLAPDSAWRRERGEELSVSSAISSEP